MKRAILWALLIIGLLFALQAVVGRKMRARFKPMLEDPRWKEAISAYRTARQRGEPQVELEKRKREIGRVFQELRSEHK